ncbi:hypothetical protein K438DRAFT_1973879 [Mycena galopus ATCC 62051]|nr:hypothetical protein K438DRAFT_1973879 [Mycena galopus ATCC 62051]
MMQLSNANQLVAVALCVLNVAAGPISTDAINATASAFQVGPNINIGTFISSVGTLRGSTLAWAAGADRCSESTFVQFGSGNFCNIPFTVQGLSGTFVFRGCGGPFWVDRDGSFYANCGSFGEALGCFSIPWSTENTIQTTYACRR